ncbi:uncharacterized protein EURHEDRAFT_165355 [Aspergillus ruber CBS 135680]|uniref:Uncharacterized protein n=1 Tax=Aspergillus ruber (strain CBS 135680) TaxID=1388766 RepID=A0A017S8K9_ASPRC|nr:uncharacterized protein EURHEDRAFT_165355 [Aspergillus ruber CBS 135680]EYE93116.1 hypothetical protein EURHEDRAFT_165355 [Aspergillus ruber CBS 135680]
MKPCLAKGLTGHGCFYKEVHWSPTVTTIQHPQSDPPASRPSSTLDIDYLEHVRSFLDHQRENFEIERSLFAEERRLWGEERRLLKSRISELEANLRGNGNANANGHGAHSSVAANAKSDLFGPPLPNYSKQVREGSSPRGRLAGIFGEVEKSSDEGLFPYPSKSRTSLTVATVSVSTPKSRVPRKVIARVMTPPSPAAPPASESQKNSPAPSPTSRHRNALKLKLSELGPPDRNLTRDAGHTPMVAVVETETDTDKPSPSEGNSLSRQPTENSESYFPDLPEDPALKGPLSLLNEEEHDRGFLEELNQKLMDKTSDPSDGHKQDKDEASSQDKQP